MAGLTPLQMMAIEKMEFPTLTNQTTGRKPLQTAKMLRFTAQSQQLFSMLS